MDKKKYYEESERLNLPKRCPLISECQRRLLTLKMVNFGMESIDIFEASKQGNYSAIEDQFRMLPYRGQGPEGLFPRSASIQNACPEVSLFESGPKEVKGRALESYSISEETRSVTNDVEKHYSECSEFCYYQWHKK
jgi:hypothetical protein